MHWDFRIFISICVKSCYPRTFFGSACRDWNLSKFFRSVPFAFVWLFACWFRLPCGEEFLLQLRNVQVATAMMTMFSCRQGSRGMSLLYTAVTYLYSLYISHISHIVKVVKIPHSLGGKVMISSHCSRWVFQATNTFSVWNLAAFLLLVIVTRQGAKSEGMKI